jgi:predicted MFS family arabinose efflux permease
MAWAEALRVLSLLGILALAVLGRLTLPILAALGFVGACGTVAYSVAAPALVPALVAPAALAAANARIELARTLAFTGGPALAGALVAWTGGAPAFGLAAALSAGAVLLLARVREPARPARPPRDPLDEMREGARFVFRHPLLLPVFLTQVVFTVALFVLQAAYVPHAVHRLGLSAAGVGATLACYGAGMVSGALLAGPIIRAVPFGAVIAIGPVAGLAAGILMALTIWVPSALLAGAGFFLVGVGPILWVISTSTLRQSVTPGALLGRAAAINSAGYGARPVGAAIGALVGGVYGPETCLVLAALAFLVQAIVMAASPLPRLARQPAPVARLTGSRAPANVIRAPEGTP